MKTIKLLNRQLMGKSYHSLVISLLASLFVFLLMSVSGVYIVVKPFFFYACIGLFTMGIARQTTKSIINDGKLHGLLQLPFIKNRFLSSLVCSTCLYVLGTKTLIVFSLFSSVMEPKLNVLFCSLLISIFCCIYGMFFALPYKLPQILAVFSLIACGVFAWLGKNDLVLLTSFISLSMAGIFYFRSNPYDFLQLPVFRKHQTFLARGNFINYLFRYFMFHKNYLINSAFLIALAVFLPFMFLNMKMGTFYLLGLGILSINTPLSILFSSNRTLLDKVKSLPNQKRKIIVPYFLLLLVWNCIPSMIYLFISKLLSQPFGTEYSLLALSLIVINSVGVVLLEWYFPFKNWHVESDLWHHPRKYIMPSILIVLTMLVLINKVFLVGIGLLALCSIGLLLIVVN
ncbi:hypothetical protein MXL46_00045 [Heyndrickxia sporothermodurans]|uniref:Uncharacterized protein n=1 Tax=Heyndrickxia sporothermodurans TaxID=46224 RepID=A0A150LCY7_9BACI|nr:MULTISPECIES: hypothetical protein [Bacillaceae]KYD09632.1 hypothetical protein B4102_2465 [Heyndrickxia sporothermodurans]MCU5369675.1 hypothetical protein [Bacillus paranthracis]MDA1663405.1 hypothetical protein [Bacillus cereus group sp. TH153LC]MEB6547495.1 hypothetical protein [Heyndrickxia sporothermodurans]MED4934784.1 hypothetical protein [Heyndrickxia coagulans]